MDFTKLLPIGSVVLLEGATKRLMIYGVGQIDTASNTEYDYIGVIYPEGNMGEGSQFLFNHDDIQKIDFRGFEDSERDIFLNGLRQAYNDDSNK